MTKQPWVPLTIIAIAIAGFLLGPSYADLSEKKQPGETAIASNDLVPDSDAAKGPSTDVAEEERFTSNAPSGKPIDFNRIEKLGVAKDGLPQSEQRAGPKFRPISRQALRASSSRPLRSYKAVAIEGPVKPLEKKNAKPPIRSIPNQELDKSGSGSSSRQVPDAALLLKEAIPQQPLIASPIVNFEGQGNLTDNLMFGGISVPPDTVGDVGPNHYVQTVNTTIRAYDKAGNTIAGPVPINVIWTGFGGACESNNDGDPIVLYDQLADRWLISQFALSGPPFHQCIAISQSGDPIGTYYLYDFEMPLSKVNDYPKFGVWNDAYYMTDNQFDQFFTAFLGGGAFAFDREKMLNGDPTASYIYFDLFDFDPTIGGMLPSDADGLNPPAPGTPNYFIYFIADEFGDAQDGLRIFEFHADFANPLNSTFTERADSPLSVATFNPLTPPGRTDIPQPPPALVPDSNVDAIGDRLMHRLQYRNYGDHAMLTTNHTVDADPASGYLAGVRYYVLRLEEGASGTFSVDKQATLALDEDHRWMGSSALDASGNMGVGYSISSETTFPSIRYFGVGSDGTLLGEGEVIAGTGSQTEGQQTFGFNRWGDYSSMNVDPIDDCTFWYTQEYYESSTDPFVFPFGVNWQTRIAAFQLPGGFCETPATGTIQGSITEQDSGDDIVGARAIATDGDGNTFEAAVDGGTLLYSRSLPPGDYSVLARALNCADSAPQAVTITEGNTSTADFVLNCFPVLEFESQAFDDSATGNNNGQIDPNECIELDVTLRNVGLGDAEVVSATLVSNTVGVTIPDAHDTQTYPDIAAEGGSGTNDSPFQVSISPAFPCGDDIHLTLNVTTSEGTFEFPITLATGAVVQTVFSATGPVPIPDGNNGVNGPAVELPVVVSGVTTFDKMKVAIHVTHPFVADLDISLVGPDGTTTIVLSSDNGGAGVNYGTDCPADDNDTIFDDDAADSIDVSAAPFVGTFRPEEPLSTFAGLDPNGTWKLVVSDDFQPDTGIIECVSIIFEETVCTPGSGVCEGSIPILEFDNTAVSGGNGDDNVDVDECFDLNIGLRNDGTATATGLNATLTTTTPGVVILSGVSAYPDIAPGAVEVNSTPFQLQTSSDFVCTTDIELTLTVTTPDGDLTFPISLPTGGLDAPLSFSATGPVDIPDDGDEANPAELQIPVSGVPGVIGRVTVAVHLTHTWDGDIDMFLVAPDGTTTVQLSTDNGGSGDNYGTGCPADGDDTTFDDEAAGSITDGVVPFVGTFRPEEALSAFNGLNANGNWTLRVSDDAAFDTGALQCVTLNIQPLVCDDADCGTLHHDTFDDDIQTWNVVSGTFVEADGTLQGSTGAARANSKAEAYVGTPWSSGATECSQCKATFGGLSGTGGNGSQVRIRGWVAGNKDFVDVTFKGNKVKLHQKAGNQSFKGSASFTFTPNTLYDVELAYDGDSIELSIGGNSVLDVPTTVAPNGNFGLEIKKTSISLDEITIDEL